MSNQNGCGYLMSGRNRLSVILGWDFKSHFYFKASILKLAEGCCCLHVVVTLLCVQEEELKMATQLKGPLMPIKTVSQHCSKAVKLEWGKPV